MVGSIERVRFLGSQITRAKHFKTFNFQIAELHTQTHKHLISLTNFSGSNQLKIPLSLLSDIIWRQFLTTHLHPLKNTHTHTRKGFLKRFLSERERRHFLSCFSYNNSYLFLYGFEFVWNFNNNNNLKRLLSLFLMSRPLLFFCFFLGVDFVEKFYEINFFFWVGLYLFIENTTRKLNT